MGSAVRVAWVAMIVMACGRNGAPVLEPVGDQRAAVDVELTIALRASDPDGDPVKLSFASELPNIQSRARITGSSGEATFRWTPLLADVGVHTFTFRATDGEHTVSTEATITVSASEGQSAPWFVQPLGNGTTLDLAAGPCLEVPVAVSDPDTPGVTLTQADPILDGAELVQHTELTATWTFCPSRSQIASGDRFPVRFAADDFDHPTVHKDYLVVLLGDAGESCPGEVPVVQHTPSDWDTVGDLTVTARVRDAEGLKFEPLLYYTLEPPSVPVDITKMIQLTMQRDSGTMTDGQWSVRIPNPVANGAPGSQKTVYYVITATDNDDLEGPCDHTVRAPASGTYSAKVTHAGGSGGLEICEPCSADAQCGDAPSDLCVPFSGQPTCFAGCSHDSDCPTGHYCSFSTFTSVDGEQGRQCLPDGLTCDDPVATCVDDAYEENDSAHSASALVLGRHVLESCAGDEDWFVVTAPSEGDLDVILDGSEATDLDLALYDGLTGALLDSSNGLTSLEAATACVPAGPVLVHVRAWGAGDNTYTLDVDHTPRSCAGTCLDDPYEPDDDEDTARWVDRYTLPYVTWDGQICPYNEDWYVVYLYRGEELWVTALFDQTGPSEDLDLMVLDSWGTILVGCEEHDPYWCDPFNGQRGTSDESLYLPIEVEDFYFVIVRGWAGASNAYALCIGLDPWDC